ncbi:MAG: hypothetical protein QOF01_4560 [Thermomicrobiales bacterium]|nr:hypothetical protein [Thermomicrobiales bacterium]
MTWRATQRRLFLASLLAFTVLLAPLLAAATRSTALRAAECTRSLPVSERRAREILKSERPFSLDDHGLFHSWEHPDWEGVPPPESRNGPALSEKETREALRHLLTKRFPCTPEDVHYGLAVYADPVARQKLPDPTLRAALAGLVGTLGEPAILYLLYEAPVTSIHFGVGFAIEDAGVSLRYAATWNSLDGTQQIVFDRKYRFSDFGAFSALLFHEALHVSADDEGAGEPEEVIALSLEALVYAEMLLADPAIAQGSEALTRSLNNHTTLLRLNSGPEGSDRMTLLVPGSDVNIDPTATEPITQFYDLYNRVGAPASEDYTGRETPGNSLLQRVLDDLAEPGESAPRDAGFDAETLDFLNRNHAALTPAELIAVACVLRLDVECD